MGLLFRPRRSLLRFATGAATAGIAYHAGKSQAQQDVYNEEAAAAYQATQPAPQAPAAGSGPGSGPVPAGDPATAECDAAALDELFSADITVWSAGATASSHGAPFTLHGATVAEFDGDRISALRHYWNEVELLEGLGLLPAG